MSERIDHSLADGAGKPNIMGDISLLPEDLRGQEEHIKEKPTSSSIRDEVGLKMHVPDAMVDEDIEIIEVDEGDLAAVLSEEPFMTRLTYKLSLWIDQFKDKFLKSGEEAAPAKAPPQFFKPPKKGLITSSGAEKISVTITPPTSSSLQGSASASAQGGSDRKTSIRARITPQTEVPRRVRVIKRVRKPVRVSLISAEDLAVLSIDVGKRKWTLGVFILLFTSLIVGGYFFITFRLQTAKQSLVTVQMETATTEKEATDKSTQWKQYEDLEGRLKILQQELKTHIIITKLFDFLEKNTLPGVSYKNASWSGTGQLTLDVVADSFDSAGGQVIVLKKNPLVLNADASGYAISRNSETGALEHITYQLAIKLKPDVLQGLGLETDDQSASSTNASVTSTQP